MTHFRKPRGMQLSGIVRAFVLGGALVPPALLACGGSSPAPVSAEPAPVATASGSAPVGASAVPPPASTAAPPPSASSSEPPKVDNRASPDTSSANAAPTQEGTPKLDQPPTTIVTAAGAAFLIDYRNSEVKTKAEANCAKEKKDDAAAKAACMDKAREQFLADVLVFKSDKKGHETLTIYKRTESNLREVFTAPVSLKDAGPNSLQVKFKGGGSGQRPLFKNTNSPTIQLPNSYTLEIDDPQFGKLRYDEKIGLVNQ